MPTERRIASSSFVHDHERMQNARGGYRSDLDRWMTERIGVLGITWEDLAEQGRVSRTTLWSHRLKNGEGMNVRTATRIERALKWQLGSIRRIREGKEPIELPIAD